MTAVPRSAQLSDIRQQNYSTIMRELMRSGPTARTDLATAIGMSTGSVTRLTGALVRSGLVTEVTEPTQRGMGRPKVPVAIDGSRYGVIGVHFGLHRTMTCLIDLRGRLIAELPTTERTTNLRPLVRSVARSVHKMLDTHDLTVLGVGASTGGWVDSAAGKVHSQPVLGWQDAPLAAMLGDLVDRPIRVDSQVRALALAEHWFGAATGVDNFIHLFVGNVIGAGYVFNGSPYRGAHSAAGGLDHLPVAGRSSEPCTCGSRTCFAAVGGDLEVARRARAAGLISGDQEVYDVFALAVNGDARARRLLQDRAALVGTATATLIELLDPELVVIGGGIAAPVDHVAVLRESARAKLAVDRGGDVEARIRASAFGPHALGIAAAAIMLDAVYRSPETFVAALRANAV
ncbi:putative NBD/HSP70 family sugar kinase [Kribbella amoyensis]|uniref:Putative NBD/HSP70 family sugar kinase n=1 Tax=Kribbella amoyensis TaxID=996641 RepID=A0A561BUP1_9ACTN|nr:ROK family transcriptional regulator [Kribbella amoyensis]TWD82557.1 putative NBD/HSP70 family sugar kinase [Kribbella amoyensis]